MKFITILVGGPLDMVTVVIVSGKFEMGMTFTFRGSIYKVLNGPVAKCFEIDQEGHPNLAVRSEYVEKEE